jgi:hypothetical protein
MKPSRIEQTRHKLRLKRAKLNKLSTITRKQIECVTAKILSAIWHCETTVKLDVSGESLTLIHKRPQGANVILNFEIEL